MKKNYYIALIALAGLPVLWSYSSGPGNANLQVSGAPGEGTCVSCHSGNALNSGGGSVSVELGTALTQYVPGQSYSVTVVGSGSAAQKYGFQLSAVRTSDNSSAGTFTAGTGTALRSINGKSYIEHNTPSTSGNWTFTWDAPATDVGEIVFYVAGNSAESPGGTGGDNIYTDTLAVTANVVSVASIDRAALNAIYPNPASDVASAKVFLETQDQVSAQVIDLNGKVVLTVFAAQSFSAGEQNIGINTSNLQAGYYRFQIVGTKTNISLPFVKQ